MLFNTDLPEVQMTTKIISILTAKIIPKCIGINISVDKEIIYIYIYCGIDCILTENFAKWNPTSIHVWKYTRHDAE